MIIKEKKAGERILSIYLFIIYIIVSIGIVSGVLLVYGKELDVREVEAGVLGDKIIDCLTEQGILNEAVFTENFDLLDFCRLDFSEEEYAVRVELLDFYSNEQINKIEVGRKDFFEFCNEKGEKLPKCDEKEVYVLRKFEDFESSGIPVVADPSDVSVGEGASLLNEERIILKVLSAVGKTNKNVW